MRAKLGEGPAELVAQHVAWDKAMRATYADACVLVTTLFAHQRGFNLLVEPKGAFFAVISSVFLHTH